MTIDHCQDGSFDSNVCDVGPTLIKPEQDPARRLSDLNPTIVAIVIVCIVIKKAFKPLLVL